MARALARPLVRIAGAAHDIAMGRAAEFPDVRVPELANHVDALRAMHHELERRFDDLRREREESRTLLEALSDGVIAADQRGNVISTNAAARRLLGYGTRGTLPPLSELFHDRTHRAVMREVLAGAIIENRELDLGERTVMVSARAIEGAGTLIVLSDVTELRRLETVRRDFVANVSHELKTPLTAIAGYAETLAAEAASDAQAAKFAQTIVDNARRMQRLVDDLLDLSRIESGSWHPEPRMVGVDASAREAWRPFAERAASRNVELETVSDSERSLQPSAPCTTDTQASGTSADRLLRATSPRHPMRGFPPSQLPAPTDRTSSSEGPCAVFTRSRLAANPAAGDE